MNAEKNLYQIQMKFFEIFESQDPQNVYLDVVFDIGGKKLYGNKTKLCIVSPTFESMLSERWTSKNDESIQINEYKFEDFKEFLTFIYSGECSLTDENIFAMIDMAEFYGVPIFKDVCDEYLAKMDLSLENVLTILETSNKYSLVEVKISVQNFISTNFMDFIKCERFLYAQKEIVEEFITCVLNVIKPEELFQAVYEWVEHQVKQNIGLNGVNLNEVIKTEMSPFLRYFQLKKMNAEFLVQYVVKKGFLFSYDELSDILNHALQNMPANVKIKITNLNRHSISGYLPRDSDAVKVIKTLKEVMPKFSYSKAVWWNTKCKFLSTPSQVKERDGVEWYLILFEDGDIGVTHFTQLPGINYILAEMTADFPEFVCTRNSTIEIE